MHGKYYNLSHQLHVLDLAHPIKQLFDAYAHRILFPLSLVMTEVIDCLRGSTLDNGWQDAAFALAHHQFHKRRQVLCVFGHVELNA